MTAPYHEIDPDLPPIPDFLRRKVGAKPARRRAKEPQRKWIMPGKSVKQIKRELLAEQDEAVYAALETPGTLGIIAGRAKLASNLTKSSLRRLIKVRRAERRSKRVYGRV